MLINRAPQVTLLTVDSDKYFVEVPLVAGAWAPSAQPVGVGLPELIALAPDRLIGDHHTAFQHQFLDLAEAQRKPKVQPNAVVDDLDRVAVALIRRCCGCAAHPADSSRSATPTNVTVPDLRHQLHDPPTPLRPHQINADRAPAENVGAVA